MVYFGFDQPMTATLLLEIVEGSRIATMRDCFGVSDIATPKVAVWMHLGVSVDKPYFVSSAHNNVYVYADAPHLLTLARNPLVQAE